MMIVPCVMWKWWPLVMTSMMLVVMCIGGDGGVVSLFVAVCVRISWWCWHWWWWWWFHVPDVMLVSLTVMWRHSWTVVYAYYYYYATPQHWYYPIVLCHHHASHDHPTPCCCRPAPPPPPPQLPTAYSHGDGGSMAAQRGQPQPQPRSPIVWQQQPRPTCIVYCGLGLVCTPAHYVYVAQPSYYLYYTYITPPTLVLLCSSNLACTHYYMYILYNLSLI